MTEGIEAITQTSLSLALDAASLRHQVISNNIANSSAEGFIPMQVKFSTQMEEARRQLSEGRLLDRSHLAAMAESSNALEPAPIGPSLTQQVRLDSEVAQMAQNAVHYQALLKGLSRHMGIMSLAVADGKR